ncbi:MAG: hypothetical protein O7G88_07790, partial [bacterium]|nr:hypothetical protein [bacterium]
MAEINLTLHNGRLQCEELSNADDRVLTDSDFETFEQWALTYRDILRQRRDPPVLLELGRHIYAWLDGDLGWLARLKSTSPAPLLLIFTSALRPNAPEMAFLQVPWELLADDEGHWAQRQDLSFMPVRRFGKP